MISSGVWDRVMDESLLWSKCVTLSVWLLKYTRVTSFFLAMKKKKRKRKENANVIIIMAGIGQSFMILRWYFFIYWIYDESGLNGMYLNRLGYHNGWYKWCRFRGNDNVLNSLYKKWLGLNIFRYITQVKCMQQSHSHLLLLWNRFHKILYGPGHMTSWWLQSDSSLEKNSIRHLQWKILR